MKQADIEKPVEHIKDQFKVNVIYNFTKNGKDLVSVQFEFPPKSHYNYPRFMEIAKNISKKYHSKTHEHFKRQPAMIKKDELTDYGVIVVQIDPLYIKKFANNSGYVPSQLLQLLQILKNEAEEKPREEKDFNLTIEKIKSHYNEEITELSKQLSTFGTPPKDIQNLTQELHGFKNTLFKAIKFDASKNDVIHALVPFIENSRISLNKYEQIMDSSRLERSIEVTAKAILILFVGMGMLFGSVVGQGLAKAEHRQLFKEKLLTLNKTPASQIVSNFLKEDLEFYQEGVDAYKKVSQWTLKKRHINTKGLNHNGFYILKISHGFVQYALDCVGNSPPAYMLLLGCGAQYMVK